ncbi:MAG: aminotransferase class III-fold pyridoxal phosphate-dependent enzyme, partial [Flavitalea sp.]
IQYWKNKNDTKRTRIIALNNAYHGDTFGAMSISSRGIFTLAFQDRLFDVLFTDPPKEGKDIQFNGYAAELTDQLLDETACIIYEPLMQGAGGMLMYEPQALEALLLRCKAHGIICIADEVMTGFGRTGKLFASSYCSTAPDIVCLSKGLTGGTMALGITACIGTIHQAFVDDDKMKSLFHGHSFTANPIACSAALASLDLLEKPSCAAGIALIIAAHARFKSLLETDAANLNIKNIRQLGTIIAFEVNDAADSYFSQVRDRFTAEALQKGVYLRPLGNTVYLMPPYCITDDELQLTYSVILDILRSR